MGQEITHYAGQFIVYWWRTIGDATVFSADGLDYWPTLRQALRNAAALCPADNQTYRGAICE